MRWTSRFSFAVTWRPTLALCLLFALEAEPLRAQTTMYTWTDEAGVAHYSNSMIPASYVATATTIVIPIRSERSRPIPLVILGNDASRKFVRASLTGKWAIREVLMLVDTGAQKTVIDEVLAKELAVEYEQDVQLAGITSTVRTWMGRLPRLRLGTEEISNLQVVVSPRPGRLLLGMDVLEKLQLVVGLQNLHQTRSPSRRAMATQSSILAC